MRRFPVSFAACLALLAACHRCPKPRNSKVAPSGTVGGAPAGVALSSDSNATKPTRAGVTAQADVEAAAVSQSLAASSDEGTRSAADDNDEDVWAGLTETEIGEAFRGHSGVARSGSVRQAEATVEGAIDADIVGRIVRAHINEVRWCYREVLAKKPELAGRLTVRFTIASTGKVSEAEVSGSTADDEGVGACVAKAIKRWKFPKPAGGGSVVVSYPSGLLF